jgi:hypothetical protein
MIFFIKTAFCDFQTDKVIFHSFTLKQVYLVGDSIQAKFCYGYCYWGQGFCLTSFFRQLWKFNIYVLQILSPAHQLTMLCILHLLLYMYRHEVSTYDIQYYAPLGPIYISPSFSILYFHVSMHLFIKVN